MAEFLKGSDCSSDTVGGELLHFVSPSGTPMAEQVVLRVAEVTVS